VTLEGDRDVLGMWFQETEGAKFWMQVLVRHEAPQNRMEVQDHHRLAVAAARAQAEGSPTRETLGRVASGPDNDGTGWNCQTARARQARQKGVREEPAF
jgi:hypothetical protein